MTIGQKKGLVESSQIKLDKFTENIIKIAYVRVLVEINNSIEFLSKIPILTETEAIKWQEVAYEWKPMVCSNCNSFGHNDTHCEFIKIWRPKETTMNQSSDNSDMIIEDSANIEINLKGIINNPISIPDTISPNQEQIKNNSPTEELNMVTDNQIIQENNIVQPRVQSLTFNTHSKQDSPNAIFDMDSQSEDNYRDKNRNVSENKNESSPAEQTCDGTVNSSPIVQQNPRTKSTRKTKPDEVPFELKHHLHRRS